MAFISDRMEISAPAWLRGTSFDTVLIAGLAGAALGTGLVIALFPASLALILLAETWLLGYPHVMSTFARLFRTARA